jgi:hypothetical protein
MSQSRFSRKEFYDLVLKLLDFPESALFPADRPWSLSPPEEFKIAVFLETVTGEHYEPSLLKCGILSLEDCFAVYETKRAHQPTRAADHTMWTDALQDVGSESEGQADRLI